jgi:hypothetical protein
MSDFPNQVFSVQAPGNAGDFASANPRASVLAGEGGLISGAGVISGVAVSGCVIGRFGWVSYATTDNDNAPATLNTFGSGLPAGLVARRQVGMITAYLGTAVQYLQSGFQIMCYNEVDMWVVNNGAAAATVGMKAFANYADGSASFAAALSTPSGGSGSASSIAPATANATASTLIGDLFTAGGTLTGNFYPGSILSGTGVATGTQIVSQILPLLAGEAANGLGRYNVNIPEQNAALTTITGTYGVLTVGGTVVSGFGPGQILTGSGVTTGTVVTQQLTGSTGAAGTYVVSPSQTASSTAISAQASIETKWRAVSSGAVGELIKVTNII